MQEAQLIESGIDINAQDVAGETALMYAAKLGDIAVVATLLKSGASPRIATKEGVTAHSIAVNRRDKITQRIIENALNKQG